MEDNDAPMREKLNGSEAREWVEWLEDYKPYELSVQTHLDL